MKHANATAKRPVLRRIGYLGPLIPVILLASSIWMTRPISTSTTQSHAHRVTLRSLTPGLKVVHWEQTPQGKLRLRVLNNYSRNVDAFAVSEGQTLIIHDLTDDPGRPSVHPGETHEFDIPSPSAPEDYTISFHAATFDDGSSTGHPDKVRAIRNRRSR